MLTPQLHQRFDIVGFDPRGVGASTPLRCFTDPAQAALMGKVLGQFPLDAAQRPQLVRDMTTVDGLCGRNGGPLLRHLSTANVARDLDRLRALFGQRQLSYYGLSYGSYLGETYANLFPGRVGAVAIDAIDDPIAFATGYPWQAGQPSSYRLGEHFGAQQALQSFLDACAIDRRCAFRGSGVDLLGRWNGMLSRLRQGPVRITDPGSGQPAVVRYQDLVNRTQHTLVDAGNSPALARFLAAVEHAPPALETHLSGATVPTPVDSVLAGGATSCTDMASPGDPGAWQRSAARADAEAPGFGSAVTYLTLPCSRWPATDKDRYTGPWNRHTAHPLLLLANSKGDPETPYIGAQRTARHLGDARLLTLDSFGHGARGKSACIDTALNAYLIDHTLPAAGTVCTPAKRPFD